MRRSDGQETRGKLLAAASRIFAEVGFRDARVADICKAAGANVAAVNYYFGSKERLYSEAWRHAFSESIAAYPLDGGVPAEAPAEERLRGWVTALLNRVLDPECIEFDIMHKEMSNPTGLLFEEMQKVLTPLREGFQSLVRELLGAGAPIWLVDLCDMSIHAQCFDPMLRERRRRKLPPEHRPPRRSIEDIGVERVAEHIMRFSLAGLRDARERLAQGGEASGR